MATESAGGAAIEGIRRIVRAVAWLLRASLIAAAAVMLACIAIQVVMRYVFGQTPSWSEEVAILMFAWTTLGGLALGIHEGFHVRLTLALDPLPGAGRAWAERGIDLIAARVRRLPRLVRASLRRVHARVGVGGDRLSHRAAARHGPVRRRAGLPVRRRARGGRALAGAGQAGASPPP